MDVVEKLFEALPDPNQDHETIKQEGDIDINSYSTAISEFSESYSEDPDHLFLVSPILGLSGSYGVTFFRQQIGNLALSKPVTTSITSQKDRQLQYYRWISQGRKDEDCPLNPNAQGPRPKVDVATHEYLPDGNSRACSNCGKGPDGLDWCSACPVKVDDLMVVCSWYCGKHCQEQHWPHHKKTCTARKKLWKAVELIQALYIKFLTYSFNQTLKRILVKEGIVYLVAHSELESALTGRSEMQIFPRDQAPSEETFLAAIMIIGCRYMATVCKPLLDILLKLIKALRLHIEEICFIPRNVHRPTCIITESKTFRECHAMFHQHRLLRATLPDGEQMAVDFSSPQMGWRETLSPWALWAETRALHVFPPEEYGFADSQEAEWRRETLDSKELEGDQFRKNVFTIMHATVRDQMARGNVAKATKLFSLDKPQYDSLTNNMLSSVEESLVEELQQSAQSRVGLRYYDDFWDLRWTRNAAQAAALDDVWLTDAEVEAQSGNRDQLEKIWASRCRGSQKHEQFQALGMIMEFGESPENSMESSSADSGEDSE